MDRLRAMEVFIQVVETGSFIGAARALHIPRATATSQVQALEARLGIKLLHRTTRRVSLTPEGALYFEEARRLVRELGEVESRVRQTHRSARGRIRVDVPSAAGRQVIAPALPEFLKRNPEVVVELGSTDRPVDLLAEGLDCVIRGGDVHDESLVGRRLAVLPVITCAAPSYLGTRGTPSTPEELKGHTFVGYFSSRTGRVFEIDFERASERISLPPAYRVAANDAGTWIALAVAGAGLVQTPVSPAVREHLRRGELVRVLPEWSSESLALNLLYPRTRQLAARVRVFVDWVVELYRREEAAAKRMLTE